MSLIYYWLRLGLALSPTSVPITVVADFSNVTESYENSACAPQPSSVKPGREKENGEFSGAEVLSSKIFDQQQAGGPLLEIALRNSSPLWLGLTQSNVHEGKVPRRYLEQRQNFQSPLHFSMKIRQPLPLKHWCLNGEIDMQPESHKDYSWYREVQRGEGNLGFRSWCFS